MGGKAKHTCHGLCKDLPVDYPEDVRTEVGVALVGGVAVGLYPGFSMIEEMNQTTETFIPDPAAQSAYDKIYPIFENAYKALVPVFDAIAEL